MRLGLFVGAHVCVWYLALSDLRLTLLPPWIGYITNLTTLRAQCVSRLLSTPLLKPYIFHVVVVLSRNELTFLPDSVTNLVHLRMLNLSCVVALACIAHVYPSL